MRVQKRSSRQSVSSAPKIKPKRKMRKHRWKALASESILEPAIYECSRCAQHFVPNLLSVYEANWRPPTHGCIPALKNL